MTLRILLIFLTARIGYEIVSFYMEAPFPSARFSRFGHPVLTSWKTGFATILAAGLFLQSRPRFSHWDWLPIITLPFLLLATLYTHTRGTALALFVTTASLFLGFHKRRKKTIILLAIITGTLFVYTMSMSIESTHKISDSGKEFMLRDGGLFGTNTANASARFDMWKDHLSRMNTPTDWIIGHGLGFSIFVKHNISPKGKPLCYIPVPDKGFILHPHSGFIWTLYHGGLIGLMILVALLSVAGLKALWNIPEGFMALFLLLFCTSCLLTDGQRILTDYKTEYLIFWIPIGLAAGCSKTRNKKKSLTEKSAAL